MLGTTHQGVTLEEQLRLMDEAGVNKGLMVATTGGWEGSDPFYAKCAELGVPIQIQVGHSAQQFLPSVAHPMLLDRVGSISRVDDYRHPHRLSVD